ncbi:MAG: TetR/AcrR family transcriptional regulator [Pseudomonadota bacterium]
MADKSLVKIKKKYHHGDLREQLLEAVRELVEKHGPDSFSIAEACRLAGVSTAAPYKHFKDRDDILRCVALQAMGRLRDAMQAAADAYAAGDPRRIAALGQAYVDFACSESGVFRMMFSLTEAHQNDPDLTDAGEKAKCLVERLVAEHLGRDPDTPDVKLRAYALHCFVHGHSFLRIDAKTPDDMSAEAEAALLRLVGDAMLPQHQRSGYTA